MTIRLLTDDPLRVAPQFLGQPLASPRRRLAAFALDLAILWIPSLVAIVGAAILALRISDPAGWKAIRTMLSGKGVPVAEREAALQELAPLLVRAHMPGVPPALAMAVEEGDLPRAGEILRDYDLVFAINVADHGESHVEGKKIVFDPRRVIPVSLRAIAVYGVGALYFTLFAMGKRGQTLGKRMLGIRVVRLDGHHLDAAEGLERFVGYLHIPGSLFLSLADLWRDPNRRLPHDRVVHTAVLRTVSKPKAKPEPAKREERRDD